MFSPILASFIDPKHPLAQLADRQGESPQEIRVWPEGEPGHYSKFPSCGGRYHGRGHAHDSKTLEATLRQYQSLSGRLPEKTIVDRGYRGLTKVQGVQVWYPGRFKAGGDRNKRRRLRCWFRKRTAIEPIIGHLKSDYGLARSYLKGPAGSQMNLLLAASAWNLQLWMRQLICWLNILLRFVNPVNHRVILKPSF